MNTSELTLAGLSAVPLIVGLTELAKNYVGGRYAPLVALILGVAAGVAAQASLPHPVWISGVVVGTAAGLAASGLYSGISAFTAASATPADPAPAATDAVPEPAPAS